MPAVFGTFADAGGGHVSGAIGSSGTIDPGAGGGGHDGIVFARRRIGETYIPLMDPFARVGMVFRVAASGVA